MATVKKIATSAESLVGTKLPIKKSSPKKSTANAAFMKAMTPSPALSAVIGSAPLPRTEVTKQLWVYIKLHGLQDSKQRTMINADAKLLPIFQKPQVSMFEMTKLVNAHLS
jgi:upstream activation factor subunit UAF30